MSEMHGHGYSGPARWSLWSSGSLLSIASTNSVLSIGSVGSVLSVGSVGSAASFFSIGAAGSMGSALSSLSRWSLLSYRSTRAIGGAQPARLPDATAWLVGVAAMAFATDVFRRRRRS